MRARPGWSWFLAASLGGCLAPARAEPPPAETWPGSNLPPRKQVLPDVQSIFDLMQERYATARTLEDQGTITMVSRKLGPAPEEMAFRLRFSAAYDRAAGRFSLRTAGPLERLEGGKRETSQLLTVLWGPVPGTLQLWSSEDSSLRARGFEEAMNRTGYGKVGLMLVTGLASQQTRKNLRAVGAGLVAAEMCDEVLQRLGGCSWIYWVARSDHSLRRLTWSCEGKQSESDRAQEAAMAATEAARKKLLEAPLRMTQLDYAADFAPRFDVPIEDDRFEFEPPHVAPPKDTCLGRDAVANGDDPLVEDFEGPTCYYLRRADHRVGHWLIFSDEACVRTPVWLSVDPPGGLNRSHAALHVAAHACRGQGFGLGFALNEVAGRCAYDASVYDGFSFWARSGERAVEATLRVGTRQTEPFDYGGDGTCEAAGKQDCWDQYSVSVALEPEWRQYAVAWADLKPLGGRTLPPFDVKQITSLTLATGAEPSAEREIWLDQVELFKEKPNASPFPSPRTPDARAASDAERAAGSGGRPSPPKAAP